jgi:hypothetical protein
MSSESLPSDYEACGDCGYDHGYEYEEAVKAHKRYDHSMGSLTCWMRDHHEYGPWYDNPCDPEEFSRCCLTCGKVVYRVPAKL